MNIPVGELLDKHVSFQEVSPLAKAGELLKSGFTGYLVMTTEGAAGMEEAILLLRENEVVGALFESLKFGKQFFGMQGLCLALNTGRAKQGVFDVSRLSRQQVDLIIAFNEKIQLPKPLNMQLLQRMMASGYSAELVQQSLGAGAAEEAPRAAVLGKFGLGSIK
ncbi:MAG: hypothetical protein NTW59_04220 [Candidatus Diapherotrites archaeon]|nr:hypothetical protein [Candidatus Diapherotrites archaeon]